MFARRSSSAFSVGWKWRKSAKRPERETKYVFAFCKRESFDFSSSISQSFLSSMYVHNTLHTPDVCIFKISILFFPSSHATQKRFYQRIVENSRNFFNYLVAFSPHATLQWHAIHKTNQQQPEQRKKVAPSRNYLRNCKFFSIAPNENGMNALRHSPEKMRFVYSRAQKNYVRQTKRNTKKLCKTKKWAVNKNRLKMVSKSKPKSTYIFNGCWLSVFPSAFHICLNVRLFRYTRLH